MNWYPIDTQLCFMNFSATEDINKFITILENGHQNLGPTELTQYFIRSTATFKVIRTSGLQTIVFKISLGRRLLGTFLTIFLPTVLLNVIGHSANYFKAFFFEATISVNLTVMLVLTTMFISVSQNLPKTSYIKMIDVWLIFNLIVPFVEVLLHTYKDALREEEREVNHHGRVRKLGNDDSEENDTKENADTVKNINNWVGEQAEDNDQKMKQLKLDLISRKEDVQVNALRDYYSAFVTPNQRKLKRADFIGFTLIPSVALSFVVCYWAIGLMKYEEMI